MDKALRILVSSVLSLALLAAVAAPPVYAGPYVVQGPFVVPLNRPYVPAPWFVPGKEYTSLPNKNAFPGHAPAPGQAILWDGAGGTVNSQLYCAAFACEVDALANNGDALYNNVTKDQVPLVFSVKGAGNLYWELPTVPAAGLWASGALGVARGHIDQSGVAEIGGVEVWGPEQSSDANRYSVVGDVGGCSVNIVGGGCLVTSATILGAIGGGLNFVDLDALMVNEAEERILFSIVANGPFDGGEIWDFNYATGTIAFLTHGGHVWDTAFPVMATYPFLRSEDVTGLEAIGSVPEPGTFGLVGLALLAAGALMRRRK